MRNARDKPQHADGATECTPQLDIAASGSACTGLSAAGIALTELTPPSVDAALRLLASARAEPPGIGERIGDYELLEQLGGGAHSVVYRARQRHPVERDVAVKVLYDATEGGNLRERFLRERGLLARVNHAGVAQLLDCGETAATDEHHACPWFAMPFVEGEPIDAWCRSHSASRTLRLLLLEKLAESIGAAHAIGIVHRDLKPSNILVAGSERDPRVVVIDFGIAKILTDLSSLNASTAAPHDSLTTRQGAVVGTPEFMSPEQADLDAQRVGPSSDVFALGLIACLLLADRVPGFERTNAADAQELPLGQRLRNASEREVPTLARLAADRSLRGEIGWIVAKACQRDIAARYADARALADDFRRLRERLPIAAAPADATYLIRLVMRKHRVTLIATASVLVATLIFLTAFAVREKSRADEEAKSREALEQTLARVRTSLIPVTGKGRGDVVNEAEAIPMLEALHEMNVVLVGDEAAETQKSRLNLARAYDRVDRWSEAEPLYRVMLDQALENPERMGDRAFLRFMLGGNLRRQGGARLPEARALVLEALEYWKSKPDPPAIACQAMLEMSFVAGGENKFVERADWLAQGIACAEASGGPNNLVTRQGYGFLADHHREAGDFATAKTNYERALQGLAEPLDANTAVWKLTWDTELLWMERAQAKIDGTDLNPERVAELKRMVEASQKRDPRNPRLAHWVAAES